VGKFKEDLGLALELAGHADVVTMHRFEATDLSVKEKPDLTPVSDADLNCEKHIRDSLKRSRPRDEVLGEEFGGQACYEGRQWVIDPIDGTKNFVRGVPVWAPLISPLAAGEPRPPPGRPSQRLPLTTTSTACDGSHTHLLPQHHTRNACRLDTHMV